MKQRTVYLDSSDFSDLSRSADRISEQNNYILNHLRDCKERGEVSFYVSIVHFAEAVHAEMEHRTDSLRRAALIKELCGKNILRSPLVLLESEIKKAIADSDFCGLSFSDLLSRDDEWFGTNLFASDFQNFKETCQRDIQNLLRGLPRHERRKWKSNLDIRKSSGRELLRNLVNSNQSIYLPLPVSLVDRELVIDCCLGIRDEAELQREILRLVKDPYLLFESILDRTGHREEFYSLIRSPGKKIVQNLSEAMKRLPPLLSEMKLLGIQPSANEFLKSVLGNLKIERALLSNYGGADETKYSDAELLRIIDRCPGFKMFCFTAKNYFRVAVGDIFSRITKEQPVSDLDPSFFADMLHFVYAPYFDIFRCDGQFKDLTKKLETKTQILGKRTSLIDVLEN